MTVQAMPDVALEAVERARETLAAAQAELDAAVRAAAEHGRSWAAIGRALGVSAAVARRRFGPPPEPAERRQAPATLARLPVDQGWAARWVGRARRLLAVGVAALRRVVVRLRR